MPKLPLLSIGDLPTHDCFVLTDAHGQVRAWADHSADFGPIPDGWQICAWSGDQFAPRVSPTFLPAAPGVHTIN